MTAIKFFESKKVRTHWDPKTEKWYFSIVDIIRILTDQPTQDRSRNYWKVLKKQTFKGRK
jgi:DNA-damage-inducible protein D